jgi:hypothetical protein
MWRLTTGRRRIGCVLVGPTAIAIGLSLGAVASWAIGALLARPVSPAEATEALQVYLSVQFTSAAQAELRAQGRSTPDLDGARRWQAELQRIHATRVVAVAQRAPLLWFLQRGSRCWARMEVEEPASAGPPLRRVRYFRVDCGWLGSWRIRWETGPWAYYLPV